MSRFGGKPVTVPSGVTISVDGDDVVVKGPKGELKKPIARNLSVKIENGEAIVSRANETKESKSHHGTLKAHIVNMITGVTEGWTKQLEIVGAGYRAEVRGNTLVLNVGYSHSVEIEAPEGVTFSLEKNVVTVTGPDKDVIGQVSANIRKVRKPEPYKGKGIKYVDEVIRRKAGKQAGKAE